MREEIFVRTDIWREGKWLDLWSVVHFLSGMSVGFAIYLLKFGSVPAVVIALLLFTAYEMWEALVHIQETTANRVLDVVVGMVSFLPTFFLLAPHLSDEHFTTVAGSMLVVNIVLSIIGWRASQKAAAVEKSFRARVEEEREKLRERRRAYRKKRNGVVKKAILSTEETI